MTNSYVSVRAGSPAVALLLLVPFALAVAWAPATAQAPPSASPGVADPAAPLALTPAERAAILDAVRRDSAKPNSKMPPDSAVSVGVQLPASIALKILPDAALAHDQRFDPAGLRGAQMRIEAVVPEGERHRGRRWMHRQVVER